MERTIKKVANPLTLIAFFSGVSESIALAVIAIMEKVGGIGSPLSVPLVWFSVLFPTLIVLLFFITLNFNHKVLYAPGDFENQKDFLSILSGDYDKKDVKGKGKIDSLRSFWKPDGKNIDKGNEKVIRDWMVQNGLKMLSISAFLHGYDKRYSELQKNAVNDLSLA
uniref:Uncharacterized protein n=1 Tax=Candidatus Kentrum sp. LPFa TaxID=2126335 RepID=A0A450XNQ7_9GAMM|nr:MAG: hypothetical protein BECKLPF1236A_GA0070988_101192 [Candidatus Kentron sp. LPFa]VFK30839.1 MAG: hypothetical protein BECKLPF1236C_GA0070990_101211 [Candidatus Kentron sp. LPFa]